MTIQDPSVSTNPTRILVVDDHPNTAVMLARALQLGPNVIVTSATSGREALENITANGVDILFTDMVMPDMTGLELIEKMQALLAGKPVFTYVITAHDDPSLRVTAQRLRVKEVLRKPVRPERIYQIALSALIEKDASNRLGSGRGAGFRRNAE